MGGGYPSPSSLVPCPFLGVLQSQVLSQVLSGGVPQSQVFSLVSGPRSFLGGYPSPGRDRTGLGYPPGWDRTAEPLWPGLGYPSGWTGLRYPCPPPPTGAGTGLGYPPPPRDRTAERVLSTRRAVCLLWSGRSLKYSPLNLSEGEYQKAQDGVLSRAGIGEHTTKDSVVYYGSWLDDKMNGKGTECIC